MKDKKKLRLVKPAAKPQAESSKVVGTTKDGEKLIAITFPERHWVVVLKAINELNIIAQKRIGELRDRGITDVNTLTLAEQTALAGPVIIQGVIVKELAAHGVMTPEANERMGIDKVLNTAQDILDKHKPPQE